MIRLHANQDAPKRLGEAVLDAIANGAVVHVLYIALRELTGGVSGQAGPARLEGILKSGTRLPRSIGFYMPSGDLFLIATGFTADALRQLTHLIAANSGEQVSGHDVSALCHLFEIPDDAIPLRKLIKAYLADGGRTGLPASASLSDRRRGERPAAASTSGPGGGRDQDPSRGAPVETAPHAGDPDPGPGPSPARSAAATSPVAPQGLHGPLTLELLGELQGLLERIDVAPFIHQQAVYGHDGGWQAHYVEHFFDIARLRQTHFPDVDLRSNESLFVQFTRNLDDLMLIHVLSQRSARHGRIGINLSTSTVTSPVFDEVSRHLSADERGNVVGELHWIEFLQDIQDGGEAVRRLSSQGYRIALDRISAMVLPYLDLSASWVDFIKVPFDRSVMARVGPETIAALRACDPQKLVLTACDDPRAIALGETLGIRNYQGRLIDQQARRAA